ncbi:MAG TPA: DUF4244 domain-containing protein [Acidimicrobiales bacterium]
MLRTLVALQVVALAATDRITDRLAQRMRGDAGQSTAEYALVLVGAAAVAALVIAWATKTDKVSKLLNSVIDAVMSKVA